jgi:general secretion pathway protein L
LTVVPRERAEERFEFVRRSGFQVAGLRIVSQEPPFAATSIPLREPPGIAARPHRFVVTALSACTALLAIACVALPFVEASRAIHDLTERVADAKRQAAASVRLQKEIADQVGDRQSLALRRQKSLAMTELLDIVTRLTPDDTWLTELQVSGRELHLTGVSVSATALLGLIDQSPSFRNATFRSSITQDPQLKRERFDISATIAPREPR